jgi:hypothetical protein
MIVTYIRSSSYGNYDYCQMQYFLCYVLGWQSPSGKKAQLGTMVHKVMECLASCKKHLQDNPDEKSLKIVDDALGEIEFTKRKLYTKKFVEDLLKKSFDFYRKGCEHKYNNTDYKFCKEQIETAIEYNEGQFDPRKRNIVATEPSFDIPIQEDWAKYDYQLPDGKRVKGRLAIKGTVDLITKVEDNVIEVVDWKTGQRKNWATGEVKTYEKLLDDAQLLLYNYAISKLYPDYDQSIMSIFFTRDGGPFSMCFDKSDQDRFLEMLKKRFEEIKRNHKPQPVDPRRWDFRCKRLCHFCKTNWPGTNINMCEYVEQQLHTIGYDKTVKELTREGHDIGYYEKPG